MSKTNDRRQAFVARMVLTLLDARAPLRRQAEDWAEGFAATSGGQPGGRGSIARPTESRALTPTHGAGLANDCATTANEIDDWLHTGERLANRALRLLPLEHPVAEMLARHGAIRQIGAGSCQRCHTGVTGNGEDRLRSGWCPACYQRWIRAGRPDRARFNNDASPQAGDSKGAGCA